MTLSEVHGVLQEALKRAAESEQRDHNATVRAAWVVGFLCGIILTIVLLVIPVMSGR
jgi:heme/copper-type cytochrome/quinol oxidase subunit 4